MIEEGSTVILKPNMGHAAPVEYAVCTNPETVRAEINIVDAMYAAGGFSPHTPVPLYYGCILGSKDPVAVDMISCDIAGIDTEKVDYFRVAEEAGLGVTSREDINLVGNTVEECYRKLWVPYVGGMDSWPEYNILHENACSSCQALLASEMGQLRAVGEYDKHTDMTIVIGRKDSIPDDIPPEKLVLHGNCLRKYKDRGLFIKGCPPGEADLHTTVIEGIAYDSRPEQVPYLRAKLEEEQPIWHEYVVKKEE